MDAGTREVALEAAEFYRSLGPMAHGFARGKIKGDPAYGAILARLPDEGVLLDVGCGEGYLLALARIARPRLRLIGIDHDERRLDQGRRALEGAAEFHVGDVRNVPLPDADVITCVDVLHYQPPEQQDELLARLVEQLTAGGELLIREGRADGGLRSKMLALSERIAVALGRHKGDGVFFRTQDDLMASMARAGLRVEAGDCAEGTPFANVLYVGHRAGTSHGS